MTRIRLGFVGITAVLGLNSVTRADPIQTQATYTTMGTIGSTGIDGTPIVSFQGVSNGSLTTGQPFSLGEFVVASQPGGATTTYDTPFQITFTVTNASGDPALPQATPVTLDGVVSTNSIGLVAAFLVGAEPAGPLIGGLSPKALPSFIREGGSIAYALYPTSTQITLEPTSQNGGVFEVQGQLDPLNVPEPTPLAMLLAVGTILALKRAFQAINRSEGGPNKNGSVCDVG